MKTDAEEIAQWVIDNRYSKGEYQRMPDHELYHTLVDKINSTQRTAEVGGGWISVEERFPDHNGGVLLWVEDGEESCVCHGIQDESNENVFFILGPNQTTTKVTHWQPLPEPPKNSEDEGGVGNIWFPTTEQFMLAFKNFRMEHGKNPDVTGFYDWLNKNTHLTK